MVAAQEIVRKHQVDTAIVDFSLPDGDGLDLLRALKAQDASLPVVLLTGHGTIDLAVRAIKEGADQFLTKPVELPALLIVIERGLDLRRMRRGSLGGEVPPTRHGGGALFSENPRTQKTRPPAPPRRPSPGSPLH